MIYILCIVVYLAIGGLLAGIFEYLEVDDFLWYLVWPVLGIVLFIIVLELPIQNLGRTIASKIRNMGRKDK